jgi:hypothetical protein
LVCLVLAPGLYRRLRLRLPEAPAMSVPWQTSKSEPSQWQTNADMQVIDNRLVTICLERAPWLKTATVHGMGQPTCRGCSITRGV